MPAMHCCNWQVQVHMIRLGKEPVHYQLVYVPRLFEANLVHRSQNLGTETSSFRNEYKENKITKEDHSLELK